MNIEKALVIADPWIGFLLDGSKTWEMRSQRANHRGWMGLIRKGTGTVVAVARLVDVGYPLTQDQMVAAFDKHRIPESMIRSGEVAKWNTPWKLADIQTLARPVPYVHKPGAVTWVSLEASVQEAILAQLGEQTGNTPKPPPDLKQPAARTMRWPGKSDVSVSMRIEEAPSRPKHRRGKGFWSTLFIPSKPSEAGHKLVIDIEWDDGLPESPTELPNNRAAAINPAPLRAARAPSTALAPPAKPGAARQSLGEVILTGGNIRNGHIYLRSFFDRFPADAVGGSNKESLAPRSLTVETSSGKIFTTDLDGSKRFFRARGPVRAFFADTGAQPGDTVCVDQVAPYHYRISLRR